jgi:hypothetical protein
MVCLYKLSRYSEEICILNFTVSRRKHMPYMRYMLILECVE